MFFIAQENVITQDILKCMKKKINEWFKLKRSSLTHVHSNVKFYTQNRKSISENAAVCFPHHILQCVTHQFLLQSLHQSHFYRLTVILSLTVRTEPLRKNWTILHTERAEQQMRTLWCFCKLDYIEKETWT